MHPPTHLTHELRIRHHHHPLAAHGNLREGWGTGSVG